jgi:REP-associated tyrosine transposase
MKTEALQPGNYYHIYTHGVGGRNLFKEKTNYEYFLLLYDKYIEAVADTFAWVLMPNHLHLLVRLKENICYKYSNADGSIDPTRFKAIKWETTNLSNLSACEAPDSVKTPLKTPESVKIPKPEKHFSHLFNAYAKHFNIKYRTRGTLFERPFSRKQIDNAKYFKHLVLYIHNNPVHHGFCSHPVEYPCSSYLSCISIKPTKTQREKVVGWFDSKTNFTNKHSNDMNFNKLEDWLFP